MSMEERTLVVRNIDGEKLSNDLLEELFCNFGPLVRVVLRKTFAFIEYTKKESVGYAWAMMEGIYLQGRLLRVAPKLQNDPSYRVYRDRLHDHERMVGTSETYYDDWLNDEQKEVKKSMISSLKKSSSAASSARRRFRRYQRHFEPRFTYNHVLGKDLSSDDRRSSDGHHDHERGRNGTSDRNNNRERSKQRSRTDLRDSLNGRRHSSGRRSSSYRDEHDQRGHRDHRNNRRDRSHR